MPSITAINFDGKKGSAVSLPDSLFAAKANMPLMAQAVRVYLSNQRQATAKTKHRSEVNLTTRKMYKQKGTGRARHGAQSAPIFVGGGVAHGPQGTQNYQLSMPQKMRQKSLASALTSKLQAEQVRVISKLENLETKVKAAQKLLKDIELEKSKVTLVLPSKVPAMVKTWRNLGNVSVTYANLLNTYEVLNGGMLVLAEEAVAVMEKTFAASSVKEKVKVKPVTVNATATNSKKEAKAVDSKAARVSSKKATTAKKDDKTETQKTTKTKAETKKITAKK